MPTQSVETKLSKIHIAFWLALMPSFWPDLWRRVKLNIGAALLPAPMGQDRLTATTWAEQIAMTEEAALVRLGIPVVEPLSRTESELLDKAADIERKSSLHLGLGAGADLIYRVCEGLQANIVVETGVAYGWRSLAILASISKRNGVLFSIDLPHPLLEKEDLTGVVVPTEMRKNWILIREPDCSGLSKVFAKVNQIDFIHYDSDKSYFGRAASYRRLWARIRSGGILMSDDIADNTAFRDFAAEVGLLPVVVYTNGIGLSGARFVGLLRKV